MSITDKNKNEKTKEKIVWEYYEDDVCDMWGYEKFIKRHIQLGNKIPARVLKKYFAFFEKPVLDNQLIKEKIVNTARESVLKSIEKYRQNFSFIAPKTKRKGRLKSIPIEIPENMSLNFPPPIPHPFTFVPDVLPGTEFSSTLFVNSFYDSLIKEKDLVEIIEDKIKFMNVAIRRLYNYVNAVTERPKNGFPSEYKMTIIVGLILVSFGLLDTKDKWELSRSKYKLYTAYLNKSVEYYFDNFLSTIKSSK